MSTQYSNHRDTPMRRISTFCWGLAVFGSFGVISAIAYVSTTGTPRDAETLRAEGREKKKLEVNAAQSALLTVKEVEPGKTKQVAPDAVFDQLSTEIQSAPEATEVFVAGSDAYNKQMSAMAEKGGEGFELFKTKTCTACHGMDSNRPISPLYPKLGGQSEAYVLAQMKDFRDGKRNNGQAIVMKPLMEGLSEDEMQKLAKWIAEQKLEMTPAAEHPGKVLFTEKTCAVCHGADAKTPLAENYPNLVGQSKAYLISQLKDIKTGARHNGLTSAMKPVMQTVSDEEIEAIADWLSTPAK